MKHTTPESSGGSAPQQGDDAPTRHAGRVMVAPVGSGAISATLRLDGLRPLRGEIIQHNVLALSALYLSAMLDEMKFFAVGDKIAEQSMSGMLPNLGQSAGKLIYEYVRSAMNRITETERRAVFARAFGLAPGAVNATPNTEFNGLWIRFLSAVSRWKRQRRGRFVTGRHIFACARELALNLSDHGGGSVSFVAVSLQDQLLQLKHIYSNPEVLAAYGVSDSWQLIERVSAMYLNGAVNSVTQRTKAASGAAIIKWLADKQPTLSQPRGMIDLSSEPDLVKRVEEWLAVSGVVSSENTG